MPWFRCTNPDTPIRTIWHARSITPHEPYPAFHIASLYPLLYRLEHRGLIQGCWVEKSNQRRRRYYRLTAQGQKTLSLQRQSGGYLSAQSAESRGWRMPDCKQEIKKQLVGLNFPPVREAKIIEELSDHLENLHAEILSEGASCTPCSGSGGIEHRRFLSRKGVPRCRARTTHEPWAT